MDRLIIAGGTVIIGMTVCAAISVVTSLLTITNHTKNKKIHYLSNG